MIPFRVDYTERGEISVRLQILGKTSSRLLKILWIMNIAIFISLMIIILKNCPFIWD